MVKQCAVCGSDFDTRKRSSRAVTCGTSCSKARRYQLHAVVAKRWAAAHPEYDRGRATRYRRKYPEKRRATEKRWRDRNRDKSRAVEKRYRQKYPEKFREKMRKHRLRHPDVYREIAKRHRAKYPEKARKKWDRDNDKKRRDVFWMGVQSLAAVILKGDSS